MGFYCLLRKDKESYKIMPRSNKLGVPIVTYNLIMPVTMKDNLNKKAHMQSKELGIQVSVADLIREQLKDYA